MDEVYNGVDLELVLAKYPEYASELRPLLQAVLGARRIAAPAPSANVVRRNRVKLLERAALMQEKRQSGLGWFFSLRRALVAFVLGLVFFTSSTRLVSAASNSLPGDSLYSVKRSWENITLWFAFDPEERENLEFEYENERLDELAELFADGRAAEVDFTGIVSYVTEEGIWVSNVLVVVGPGTHMPDQQIQIGFALYVHGYTQANGSVLAETIDLSSGIVLQPEAEQHEDQPESNDEPLNLLPTVAINDLESEVETVQVTATPLLSNIVPPTTLPQLDTLNGTLDSMRSNIWIVDSLRVDVSHAQIIGTPFDGVQVSATGYYTPDGLFIAVRVQVQNGDDGANENSTNLNGNSNENENNHGDNESEQDNENHNENQNENHNDNENSNYLH